MSRQVTLNDHLQQYIVDNSVREPTLLVQLRAETAQLAQASMQIGAEQGQFMALLAKLIGARRCLEIGVFTGYSSLVVALALPNDGKIVACDVSEEWTAIARRYWTLAGVDHKIDLRLRRATRTLDELIERGESGSYDYAFIDADKTNYDAYYERVLTLLRPGGLVLLDNVLWSGRVADPAVTDADTVALRELNAKVHRDERVDVSLVGIGDGLLLARKR
jgi:caffeoyl-CoA O-methyltransferase